MEDLDTNFSIDLNTKRLSEIIADASNSDLDVTTSQYLCIKPFNVKLASHPTVHFKLQAVLLYTKKPVYF